MSALSALLRDWMPHQRWFGSKGPTWAAVTQEGVFLHREHNPVLSVHRVRVTYTDGGAETYLVPLSRRNQAAEDLGSLFIGAVPFEGREVYSYDATRDRDATLPWLERRAGAPSVGPMRF